MQLLPRYLVSNKINIVSNDTGFITEYRPVYSRTVQLYKGIDNDLQFRLLNADQKPVNISSLTPKFVAFDENNQMIIEHNGTLQDDGTIPKRGKFTVKITENDLLNVKEQYLKYNIYMVNASNEKTLTYSHSHFNNNATMFVNANAFPGPVATTSVDTFQETAVDSGIWASSTVDAQPAINGNEALHTAAFYTDGYVGNITVEGTLDNTVSDATNWFTISTSAFTGSETEPKPVNYTGVFSHVRFKADANPADKITQILVRN